MSASLERDSEDLERLGAGLFLVTTATGEAVSGVRISHTSKRGYQIVYANDFGLPDLNLEELLNQELFSLCLRTISFGRTFTHCDDYQRR